MIWFWYFCKKIVFYFGVAHGDPIFTQVGTKNGFQLKLLILIESHNIFYWKPAKKIKVGVVLGQNLGQIRSNVVKKSKDIGIIKRVFSYFTWGIPFKAKSSVCTNT